MSDFYEVESLKACLQPRDGQPTGAYVCYLHYLMGSGIKHDAFNMGLTDPLADGVPALAEELRSRLPYKHAILKGEGKNIPLDRLVALAVKRVCFENGHGAEVLPLFPDIPLAEVAGYYAFARAGAQIMPASVVRPPGRRVGQIPNVGTVKLLDEPGKPIANNVVNLPLPAGETLFTVSGIVPALCVLGKTRGPHIAMHELVLPPEIEQEIDIPNDGPIYLETIVDLAA